MHVRLFSSVSTITRYVLVIALSFVFIFPIYWAVAGSLKSPQDIISTVPKFVFKPTLDNYLNFSIGNINIVNAFWNSVVISVTSTLLSVSFAALAGYSLSRLRPRGRHVISVSILLARMIPPIVIVVPIYIFYSAVGLHDTLIGLIIPYTALNIPLATVLLSSFFEKLPVELEEAASIDGCGVFKTFWRVILPLTAPGLVATAVFSFELAWNDFVLALPLTSQEAVPLTVVASLVRSEEGVMWGKLNVIIVITIIPMIILAFVAQKWLISGLVSGAVKE